jgi:hypothetical protein
MVAHVRGLYVLLVVVTGHQVVPSTKCLVECDQSNIASVKQRHSSALYMQPGQAAAIVLPNLRHLNMSRICIIAVTTASDLHVNLRQLHAEVMPWGASVAAVQQQTTSETTPDSLSKA